jgi:hypothetical protein
MFGSFMKDIIISNLNSTHVVTVYGSSRRKRDTYIL